MHQGKPYGTDKELLAAAREGSEEAFRQLFDKYWNDLYRLASRRVSLSEDARDILQEVFLSFWNNLDHIEVEESIGAYLYTSLRNKIFNHYGKQASHLKMLMSRPFNPVLSENTIWNSLQTKELQAVIRTEISRMPPKMREIYLLSKEEQLTIAQISQLLLIAPQTVKNQLHRALERIRQGLRDQSLQGFLFLF
jgi:RNA polymerase sigma-70 factor (ECF subfamily)